MSLISYLATPEQGRGHALKLASLLDYAEVVALQRRGDHLGWLGVRRQQTTPDASVVAARWAEGQPSFLPGLVTGDVAKWQRAIKQSRRLLTAAQNQQDLDALLTHPPYAAALEDRFEMLALSVDESETQDISTLEFDAVRDGIVIAENLWMKTSWLSFEENDRSVRFRFSFGWAGHEDVAADFERERLGGALCEAIFPESAIVTGHAGLNQILQTILHVPEIFFVERIVYFNAPQGGALLHQDIERGHRGVVYAQLSGRTIWLSLSTETLLDAILTCARQHLRAAALSRGQITEWLKQSDRPPWLDKLLNRDAAFVAYLLKEGHGYVLDPGDILLLPQESIDCCAWHSVFCLGQTTGEGLSFALRGPAISSAGAEFPSP